MDSVHLYHSWAMTARNGRPNYALQDELTARGLASEQVPALRETPEQLCWVRAIIESEHTPTLKRLALRDFYANPAGWIERISDTYDYRAESIIALAVKYRLTR